ncbi:MAG: iron transporter [Rhodoferax sp.]|nr:iron transporter [Rhodoferax sp.]MDP3653390.1 iron transporter [Rhodoferax sp.]
MRMKDLVRSPRLALCLRLVAAVPGGYAMAAAAVAVCAGVLAHAGMARSEAVVLSAMLGFVFYLLWLLWAFGVRSLWRLWGVLLGGLAAGTALLPLMPQGA